MYANLVILAAFNFYHMLKQTIWLQLSSPSPSHEKLRNKKIKRLPGFKLGTFCSSARVFDALDRSATRRPATIDVTELLPEPPRHLRTCCSSCPSPPPSSWRTPSRTPTRWPPAAKTRIIETIFGV